MVCVCTLGLPSEVLRLLLDTERHNLPAMRMNLALRRGQHRNQDMVGKWNWNVGGARQVSIEA